MVWALRQFCGLPHNRVVGMAGVLDSARFRHFLRRRAGSVGRGGLGFRARRSWRHHGADAALLDGRGHSADLSSVKMGWISQQRLDQLTQRTRDGGAEIVVC
jgi:malate dehydrogenase